MIALIDTMFVTRLANYYIAFYNDASLLLTRRASDAGEPSDLGSLHDRPVVERSVIHGTDGKV